MNQIVWEPRKPNNRRQASNDTPRNPPTSQPNEEKKTPKTQTNLYDDRESNCTLERYGGAEDIDPRRTTIHLIYTMAVADLEFVWGRIQREKWKSFVFSWGEYRKQGVKHL